MEKQVALREANQRFAQYVRAVERGEAFVITRRGRPVARLVPVETGQRVLTPEQQAARARALERMRQGWDLGGLKFNRDELYER
jgi:prevent-host-death family protein